MNALPLRPDRTQRAPRIAVVGAGLAGLTCARRLSEAGCDVEIFEKSRGAGGRMATRRGPDAQWDHGAQYFTARSDAFAAQVREWHDDGVVREWSPRLRVFEADGSTRDAEPCARWVAVPGMSALGRAIGGDLEVAFNATVAAIASGASGWRLPLRENVRRTGVFDQVLLAIPAPQAASLLAQAAPDLAAFARGVRMQPCWAALLRYDELLPLDFDAAFVNRGPLRWVARDRSKPQRAGAETWVLHASADWSALHLERDPAWVERALIEAFAPLGASAPCHASVHGWRYALGAAQPAPHCLFDARLGIGLCGDWLAGERIEGAWQSGRALAARVLAARASAGVVV